MLSPQRSGPSLRTLFVWLLDCTYTRRAAKATLARFSSATSNARGNEMASKAKAIKSGKAAGKKLEKKQTLQSKTPLMTFN